MYLVITDKSYPRKLAFSYLDELSKEFWTSYGPKVEATRKPYAFVGFGRFTSISFWSRVHPKSASPDTFMSKTARLYQDTRNVAGGSNLDKLNDELQDVTRIMTKNMEELLWRGDSLDRKFTSISRVSCLLILYVTGMSHLSTSLRSESEKYRKAARNINVQAMLRQYAPVVAVVFILLIVIFWKFSG